MAQVPHELIRQVQICAREAAGLPKYDPSDPSLPSLPPLSAAIAASDASPPNLRCKNCKGMLLRGTESIICLYCGLGPHYDAVPEHICFTSTIGYQWLLRSLHLDGSEMVDLSEKSEGSFGQSSPKSLTRLSEFLDFKISWPAETVKQETSPDKHSVESKRSVSLTGVAPDKFLLKSKGNVTPDMPMEQPPDHYQIEGVSRKNAVALESQDLFRNVQSFEPAFSSSQNKNNEAFSEWEADFQSADTEIEHRGYRSPQHAAPFSSDSGIRFQDLESFQSSSADSGIKFQYPESFQSFSANSGTKFPDPESFKNSSAGSGIEFPDPENFQRPADSGIKFQDPEPFHTFSGPEVDLSAHFDSVFVPEVNLKDEKPKEGQSVSPVFDDWNSDGMWNNLSSSEPNFSGGFDVNFGSKNDPQNDHTIEYSKDNFANDDLFDDFQFQTSNADMTKNKITNEEHRTKDEDLFDDWNDFTGSTSQHDPSVNALPGFNHQVSTYDEKSSERDLFSFDKFEGDFGGFPRANLFSSLTSSGNAPTEINAIMSENPASTLSDTTSPSIESGQAAHDEYGFGQPTTDDVKMLISQLHDLSFMLETDLSVPPASDSPNLSGKD